MTKPSSLRMWPDSQAAAMTAATGGSADDPASKPGARSGTKARK